MHALLVPFGSAGDVHPFVGLGLALRRRGHRVTVITHGPFEPLLRREGLDFIRLDKPKSKDGRHAGIWDRLADLALRLVGRRWRKLARASTVVPLLRPLYEIIAERHVPGETVVAASSLALGARVAHDCLGVPLATVHLYPAAFRSAYRPPVQPPLRLPRWLPRWSKRAAYRLVDALVFDPLVGQPLNALRRELGLPPVHRAFADWRHAPQRVIGLFPDWYGTPQPDWPPQTRLTGFPRYDERGVSTVPAELETFLQAGTPPIVFTPGSAMRRADRFFRESIAACRLLGRRGLLLTRFPGQVPADLPEGIRYCAYLPFSQVLPRAAALVHHGGIGSAAQALAAGIPQLLVPQRHDQPDNARRLEDLGVARALKPRDYRGPAVAETLDFLLTSGEVRQHCGEAARRFDANQPVEEACGLIEELCPSFRRSA
jgi:UDP:flavonoid glycosyltransferase YjiC (YdhE family)